MDWAKETNRSNSWQNQRLLRQRQKEQDSRARQEKQASVEAGPRDPWLIRYDEYDAFPMTLRWRKKSAVPKERLLPEVSEH